MADANFQIRIGVEGAQKVRSEFAVIAGAATAAGVALEAIKAGIRGLESIGASALATAKLGGEMADLSARTGIATQSLLVLRQAFKDSGVGADQVGTIVNKLQKNIYEAATAGGAAAGSISDLGLSAAELAQMAPDKQFFKVADAISKIENPAQKSATAIALFGKSGGEMLSLFADDGAISAAQRSLGKMPDVLARNVPVLDSISDAIERLPNKMTQFFAGLADQIAPAINDVVQMLDGIDLTAAGQKVGAFVNVAKEAFQQGRFSEFLGDVIEAGFELGMQAATKLWDGFFEWLSNSEGMWAGIGNALLTAINSAMKGVAKLFFNLLVPFSAVADYLGDALKYSFAQAANALSVGLETVLNKAGATLNKYLGTNFSSVNLGRESAAVPDISRSWDISKQGAQAGTEWAGEFFDASTNAFRQLTKTSPFDVGTGAVDRLKASMDRMLKAREDAAAADSKANPQIPPVEEGVKIQMQRLEIQLAQQLQAINERKGAIESSWLTSAVDKYEKKKVLLERERDLLAQQISAMEALKAKASPEERIQIDQKITGLRGQSAGVGNQLTGMGPDPNSFSDQMAATMVRLQDQFGTIAKNMAQTFADVFNAAVSSISNGISGLIMGTMTWGQALANIGNSILTTVIQSIVQMGVRWVMTQILMATVGKSLMAASIAATAPMAAASSAIWAAPATLATIATYGTAAAVAPEMILGSQAIVLAESMSMFKSGGYTGDGNPDDVAGVVHRGEYVVPADAVDRIGVGTLAAISAGAASPAQTQGSAGGSPITLNLGVYDDKRRLSDWAKSNDGRTVLVDIMRQHAHEFRTA